MGDRFYSQQLGKNGYSKTKAFTGANSVNKPKRRLKADIVKHLQDLLGTKVSGLDKLTIASLDELEAAIKGIKHASRAG
jgi:hypothetical protein